MLVHYDLQRLETSFLSCLFLGSAVLGVNYVSSKSVIGGVHSNHVFVIRKCPLPYRLSNAKTKFTEDFRLFVFKCHELS